MAQIANSFAATSEYHAPRPLPNLETCFLFFGSAGVSLRCPFGVPRPFDPPTLADTPARLGTIQLTLSGYLSSSTATVPSIWPASS